MDRLWLVADGKVTPFDGDMDDYKRYVIAGPDQGERGAAKADDAKLTNADRRRLAAERRAQLAPLRKRIQGIEAEMEKLGMRTLLGVGQGSRRESQLAVIQWKGGEAGGQPIAFVGKGVVFDTGGISTR